MQINKLHGWDVNVEQALDIQRKFSKDIIRRGRIISPRLILGLDVSVNGRDEATAAAVVLIYPELQPVESRVVRGKVDFPYVPGLLSFREVPLTLEACKELELTPDLIMVDGQGIAHPRRIGLASHIGLFLGVPTIGCAKSLLIGNYKEPVETSGSHCYIRDKNGEIIGAALRTKSRVKPIFVSIGHKISLSSSIRWVLQCVQGFRLPEPTRLAHLASRGNLKMKTNIFGKVEY